MLCVGYSLVKGLKTVVKMFDELLDRYATIVLILSRLAGLAVLLFRFSLVLIVSMQRNP